MHRRASRPTRSGAASYVENSIGLVTALNPVIGYERSASIAKEALATGGSVYDLVLEKGWLTRPSSTTSSARPRCATRGSCRGDETL